MRDGLAAGAHELDGSGGFVQVGEVGVAGATLAAGGTRWAQRGLPRPASFLISKT